MGKVKNEILEFLKDKELSAPEIARSLKRSRSMVYMELYRLEAEGKVRRIWKGKWLWKLAEQGKTYILNAPIVTSEGLYSVKKISVDQAKAILNSSKEIISAVGHQATAEILSKLLEIQVPVNRIEIEMKQNDTAIVFRLKKRLPEGTVIKTIEELEQIGYELLLIRKITESDNNV